MCVFDVCGCVNSVWVCELVHLCVPNVFISTNVLILLYLQIIQGCLIFGVCMSSMIYESETEKSP